MSSSNSDPSAPQFSLTEWLVGELTAFAQPLLTAAETELDAAQLLSAIGWQTSAVPFLVGLVQQAGTAVDSALTGLDAFTDGRGDLGTALNELKTLVSSAQAISGAISTLSHNAGAANSLPGLDQLGEDLLAWMTDQYLETTHPLAHGIGTLLTLLTPQARAPQQPPVIDSSGQTVRSTYQVPSIHLNRLGTLLRDPTGFLRNVYIAGGTLASPSAVNAMADTLFPVVTDALNIFGLNANYGLDPYFDLNLDAASSQLLQRSLTVSLLDSSDSDAAQLGATLALTGADASTNGQIAAVIAPSFPSDFEGGSIGGWTVNVKVGAGGGPLSVVGWVPYPADSATWPGLDLTLTLTVGQWLGTGSGATYGASSGASSSHKAGGQFTISSSVHDLRFDAQIGFAAQATVLLNAADFADGFLQHVLPSDDINVRIALGVTGSRAGWKLQGSVTQGSAILLATFPPATLGPLTIENGRFQVTPTATNLLAAASFTTTVSLGPIMASVEGLGIALTVAWPASGGNVGPLDLAPDIVWPSGVGLSIDASMVTGGGFVSFDQAHGQYSGILQLSLESLALTGIGLIQTKNADGTSIAGGYSLLVIISVDFLPPVELGFGFSLDGAGGLLGVNRTANVDALRAGVRTKALDAVLFPPNPVASAAQLVKNLSGLFPIAPGRFLIGPMVRLRWGSPLPLLTADLGVFVELPAPVRAVILGRLRLGLPHDGEAAIVQINMDALGVIDFDQGEASLDASLYDSRVAGFALSGDMALRLGWKAERQFVLSIGGFHPAFTPPSNFPSLRRLTLALSNRDNPRLRLEAYLAVTSNTIQFGARVDLYAHVGPCSVTGMLAFDALIHLSPFGFVVDFAAAVAFRFAGHEVLGVALDGHLSGPAPWHVRGRASISLLFFTVSVSFNATIGSADPPPPPLPVRVIDLVAAQIAQAANWSALPPSGDPIVTLVAAPSTGGALRAHPLGRLSFHQRVAPLGVRLDRYGSAPVAGPTTLALTTITLGGHTVAAPTPVDDYFAPAQFFDMTDSQELSQPAFAAGQAGVTFGPSAIDLDRQAIGDAASLDYTIDFVDAHGQWPVEKNVTLDAPTAARLATTSPAARAPSRTTGRQRYAAPGLDVRVNPRGRLGASASDAGPNIVDYERTAQ